MAADLHKEQVELDWVISVHILIREEKLLPQCEDGSLLNPLFPQRLVRVQPVHWGKKYRQTMKFSQSRGQP